MERFASWVGERRSLDLSDYQRLWTWSVHHSEQFWSDLSEFAQVRFHTPASSVLTDASMPGANWFPGATLNYAEHLLSGRSDDDVALIARSQTRPDQEVSFGDLRDQVARAARGLRELGVQKGDRVCALLPNIPETVVAYLATLSLGAIWASCAPEFGARSVIERFWQIEPKVLLVVSGYTYGAKDVDMARNVEQIVDALDSLEHVIRVPYGKFDDGRGAPWDDLLARPSDIAFLPVEFHHPMTVMFSSGTTGRPKAIVHGHGGSLLEHLKVHALHWDTRARDRFYWYTTTAWTVWNAVVASMLTGATAVLFDGDPQTPTLGLQWKLAAQVGVTMFGTSPGFVAASQRAGIRPRAIGDLGALRMVSVTGAPFAGEGFDWLRNELGPEVTVNPISGGTEIAGALLMGGPWQRVIRGAMAGPALGVDAVALDENGTELLEEFGELAILRPMPSMPLYFWGDDGTKYSASYFHRYPGVWCHGDWARFGPDGHCVIEGRSDATLNRGGVRLGTGEFYSLLENVDEISDSLLVHVSTGDELGRLDLFVVVDPSCQDHVKTVTEKLRVLIRRELSPRHVPDRIVAVRAIPRTMTGKRLEVPVKRILQGESVDDVISRDAVVNADVLDEMWLARS